jgi:hypothetical protein
MKQADRSKTVSRDSVLKKLRVKWKQNFLNVFQKILTVFLPSF